MKETLTIIKSNKSAHIVKYNYNKIDLELSYVQQGCGYPSPN